MLDNNLLFIELLPKIKSTPCWTDCVTGMLV